MKVVEGKKKTILILVLLLVAIGLLFVLLFVGNDKNNKTNKEKGEQTTTTTDYSARIKKFIKNNMPEDWEYDSSKLIVDSDYNVRIILNNVDHYGLCADITDEYTKILASKDSASSEQIKTLTYECRLNNELYALSKVVGYRSENKIEIYNANGEFISNDVDALTAQYVKFYKNRCKKYSYKDVFRNSEEYVGKYAKFTGEVFQVLDVDDQYFQIMMNVTHDSYWDTYDDSIIVLLEKDGFKGRVLEDDIITVYGFMGELYSYETVMGDTNTLPSLYAPYADLVK